jgi:hypothetical protein
MGRHEVPDQVRACGDGGPWHDVGRKASAAGAHIARGDRAAETGHGGGVREFSHAATDSGRSAARVGASDEPIPLRHRGQEPKLPNS